ncbi:hypothetical protein [Actinoalloteichus spitiensis]|nr:hypothetical protein [Actinoalloteichus spitiensis]
MLRDPFSLVFSLLQPLVFLALFAPLLGAWSATTGSATPARSSGSSPERS